MFNTYLYHIIIIILLFFTHKTEQTKNYEDVMTAVCFIFYQNAAGCCGNNSLVEIYTLKHNQSWLYHFILCYVASFTHYISLSMTSNPKLTADCVMSAFLTRIMTNLALTKQGLL